jgi:hypothetical protein
MCYSCLSGNGNATSCPNILVFTTGVPVLSAALNNQSTHIVDASSGTAVVVPLSANISLAAITLNAYVSPLNATAGTQIVLLVLNYTTPNVGVAAPYGSFNVTYAQTASTAGIAMCQPLLDLQQSSNATAFTVSASFMQNPVCVTTATVAASNLALIVGLIAAGVSLICCSVGAGCCFFRRRAKSGGDIITTSM